MTIRLGDGCRTARIRLREIKGEEWSGHQSFHDVGALVYFLRAVPWVVRGFSVDSHLAILEHLDHKLRRDGFLTFSISRFMIEARKLRRSTILISRSTATSPAPCFESAQVQESGQGRTRRSATRRKTASVLISSPGIFARVGRFAWTQVLVDQ